MLNIEEQNVWIVGSKMPGPNLKDLSNRNVSEYAIISDTSVESIGIDVVWSLNRITECKRTQQNCSILALLRQNLTVSL